MSDNEVLGSDSTFRRIPPAWVVTDEKAPNGKRVSSEAFKDDRDGSSLSVYLASTVYKIGYAVADVVQGKPTDWAVASTLVNTFIEENQTVMGDPIDNGNPPHICDPAHALVVGDKSEKKRRERIAKSSRLVYFVP